jgi:hypothetical protein
LRNIEMIRRNDERNNEDYKTTLPLQTAATFSLETGESADLIRRETRLYGHKGYLRTRGIEHSGRRLGRKTRKAHERWKRCGGRAERDFMPALLRRGGNGVGRFGKVPRQHPFRSHQGVGPSTRRRALRNVTDIAAATLTVVVIAVAVVGQNAGLKCHGWSINTWWHSATEVETADAVNAAVDCTNTAAAASMLVQAEWNRCEYDANPSATAAAAATTTTCAAAAAAATATTCIFRGRS